VVKSPALHRERDDVFDGDTIRRTPYADVEHVQLLKAFLNDPQASCNTF
jgi:predicted ATPase